MVTERHLDTDIGKLELSGSELGKAWLPVYVYRINDPSMVADGTITEGALELVFAWAELARTRDLLPPSQEEYFERNFRKLEEFVAREGHVNVPQSYVSNGVHLGVWVANIKFEQANFGLRSEWAHKLEQLPGWRWLPGNDFVLLERYARREGHTHLALDYSEEGRPLGKWVEDIRDTYRTGRLAKDWIERLEAIPYWEWT